MIRKLASLAFFIIFCAYPTMALSASFSSDPDTIEQTAKSVLMLEVFDADDEIIATGSGFVAFDNRTLITNYHVVEDAKFIIANSDDGYQYLLPNVLTASEEKDIAILSFYSPTNLKPLDFNADQNLKRAESIVAIGSPIGITNTVSLGNISAVYSEKDILWVQFTAPISHGSSGGALFDDDGKVIGVTSASYIDTQNINLAVHISEVQKVYDQWDGEEHLLEDYFRSTSPSPTPSPTPSPAPTPQKLPTRKATSTPIITPRPTPKPTFTIPHKSKLDPLPNYKSLKEGDRGEDVKKLQLKLIELGYLTGDADGIFGSQTKSAVVLFNQKNLSLHNLTIANNRTQQILYHGEPELYKDNDLVLSIKDGAYAEWIEVNGNKLKIHFEVTNIGRQKTVKAFELYVYAEDIWGNKLYDNDVYYGTTEKKVSPGITVYSDYLVIPEANSIQKVYCGINKVAYTDGTIYSVPKVEYSYWNIE